MENIYKKERKRWKKRRKRKKISRQATILKVIDVRDHACELKENNMSEYACARKVLK